MTDLPASPEAAARQRLEEAIEWYDSRAEKCKDWYKFLKVLVIVAGASVPVSVAAQVPLIIPAILGAVVAASEGVQQLNQFHENWIRYRSSCEALKRERSLFLASAGLYGESTNRSRLLAERTERILSQEHGRWVLGTAGATQAERADEPKSAS